MLRALGQDRWLDAPTLRRISGVAIDVLIVAAITTLRFESAAAYLVPALILLGLGLAWAVFGLLVLAPALLPRSHWFELGLINFGMSTGTTAQGMMLLRMVDPQLRTRAAEQYALAAPLSAPFIGGGIVTFTLPLLLGGADAAAWAMLTAVAALLVIWMTILGLAWPLRHGPDLRDAAAARP